MSVITLQFGQCGNQIGNVLYEELYNDIKTDVGKTGISKSSNVEYVADSINRWFRVNPKGVWDVRSILIDTENKVVSKANNNEFYRFQNVVAKAHGGAANNWAYGYCNKSKLLLADIGEGVRREMEKACGVSSILGILSSAGGTGSGVGSKTLEMLREEYPNKIITSVVVLPYTRGEIVTQNYNSLLTLAKLYDVSDGIMLYENDVMHRMCGRALSLQRVTFSDINRIIAQELATVFQPMHDNSLWNVLKSLVSHSSYKLVQIRSAPHVATEHLKFESIRNWSMLVKDIKSATKTSYELKDYKTRLNKKLKCLCNVFIGRGEVSMIEEDLKPFLDSSLYVSWLPIKHQLSTFYHTRNFKNNKRFATFLTNNNYVFNALDSIMSDALTLFNHKAYLHHYDRYGIDEAFFANAFDVFNDIIESYKNL